ncbi:hypothetical protein LA76x_4430 [Lysobacter antibioticus]|uniref:Uncharacterized protein n=1 Tax=Lysobacter antibioticus TaxID=84531 RepID=A0A0S2FG92_LYSAN|nr:hypothetical protein LA76x_4430 [Lysobacter antibioticus]
MHFTLDIAKQNAPRPSCQGMFDRASMKRGRLDVLHTPD